MSQSHCWNLFFPKMAAFLQSLGWFLECLKCLHNYETYLQYRHHTFWKIKFYQFSYEQAMRRWVSNLYLNELHSFSVPIQGIRIGGVETEVSILDATFHRNSSLSILLSNNHKKFLKYLSNNLTESPIPRINSVLESV